MANCSTTATTTLRLAMTPRLGSRGLSLRLTQPRLFRARSLTADPCRGRHHVVTSCRITGPSDDDNAPSFLQKLSAPAAALVVCALLSGAVIPDEALAARSGGRMGGSSFRSRAPSMPRGGGGSYRQYNYYGGAAGIAPPLVGGYGYGMGYGLMPSFFFPIGFGGIFNIVIALFVLNAVVTAIQKFQNRDDDRDDFDDL